MKKKTIRKEFIAYEGKKYTIEWYYNDRMKSIALEYFNKLSEGQQDKTLHLMEVLANKGVIESKEKFNHEGDQIFVLKPSPDRFFCFFFKDAKLIVTNAYKKQSQKMPPREKERALRLKADYIKRYKEDSYYD